MINCVMPRLYDVLVRAKSTAISGCAFVLMAALPASGNARANDAGEIVHYYQKDSRYEYYHTLLRKTLEATEKEYGVAVAQGYRPEDADVTEARGLSLLMQNRIQVVFLSANPTREEHYWLNGWKKDWHF
jgi:hypothetical protein